MGVAILTGEVVWCAVLLTLIDDELMIEYQLLHPWSVYIAENIAIISAVREYEMMELGRLVVFIPGLILNPCLNCLVYRWFIQSYTSKLVIIALANMSCQIIGSYSIYATGKYYCIFLLTYHGYNNHSFSIYFSKLSISSKFSEKKILV